MFDARTCSAQPVQNTDEAPGSIAPSGQATVGSGVAYPHTSRHGSAPKVKNELDSGAPSATELAVINRIKLPTDFSPRKAISRYVDKLATNAGPPVLRMARLQFLEDTTLSAAFQDSVFYSLKFPQWPIAFSVPEPLGNNNIFVFDRTGKLILIKSYEELEKLFRDRIHGIIDDQSARTATTAFLLLAEELAQDGMYQFTIPESEIKVTRNESGIATSGIATIKPVGGNAGEIAATLVFNSKGDVLSAHQTVNLKAGMRPICQSTKLLDPDPIVRRMAEQDLLIMGKAAKPYLDEQRKKLSPPLQEAIDKIWIRIQQEDR